MYLKEMAQPGDLIFYRVWSGSGFGYKLISIAQLLRGEGTSGVGYAHVAMVDNDTDFQIEATLPKVARHEIKWNRVDIELHRIKGATFPQVQRALQAAKTHIGERYDLGMFFFGVFDFNHAEVCTTLVQKAYNSAGIKLGSKAGKLLTPNELIEDPNLFKVA